jgi:Acetyltransferase (GNAT) domain
MKASAATSTAAEHGTPPGSYDDLVGRSPQGSVFASSWWLDAVAPGGWRANAVERDGRLVAAWPTVVRRSRWGVVHDGAPITPYLGPILTAGAGAHRRRSREAEQLELLLPRLGDFAQLEARCSPAFDYWTPLHWHGFSQTTRYTWRLRDLSDGEAVFAGLRENLRREIRKARRQGLVVEDGSVGDYLPLHERSAERQERLDEARANRPVIERVDAAAAARGARDLLVARDDEGRVHSAGLFVHDAMWTYYLLGASDPDLRTSGAASLVMWAAIERAGARGTGFDFEGSMLRSVERFFRAWGGEPAPYSVVRSTRSRGFAAELVARRAARQVLG